MKNLILGVLKTGVGVFLNLIFGVASTKIMAVMLGPSGVGLYSLIRQVVTTFGIMAQGGQTALVQGIANKKGYSRNVFIRSALYLFLVSAILSVLAIEIFATKISQMLFGDRADENIALVRFLAVPITIQYIYIYLKGVINGFRAIGRLATIEILGPLVALILVYPVCLFASRGMLIAYIVLLTVSQLVMAGAAIYVIYKNKWLPINLIFKRIIVRQIDFKYFISISGTTLITSIIASATIFAIRFSIVSNSDLKDAGYFDLAWTLSGSYVMLILASFGTYYTPTLSQIKNVDEQLVLIKSVIRLTTLIMIPLITAAIILKPILISYLYSEEFMPALELVRWMLIGDYLKITCWVLMVPVIVNVKMKVYFWTEVLGSAGFFALSLASLYFLDTLSGIGASFLITYAAIVWIYYKYITKIYGLVITRSLLIPWLVGLVYIIFVSFISWDDSIVRWDVAFYLALSSIVVCLLLLTGDEKRLLSEKSKKIISRVL